MNTNCSWYFTQTASNGFWCWYYSPGLAFFFSAVEQHTGTNVISLGDTSYKTHVKGRHFLHVFCLFLTDTACSRNIVDLKAQIRMLAGMLVI